MLLSCGPENRSRYMDPERNLRQRHMSPHLGEVAWHNEIKMRFGPGHMAQLVGVLFCATKGGRFDSGQGTCLGCRFDPWVGCVWEATRRCFSLTMMFLLLSL